MAYFHYLNGAEIYRQNIKSGFSRALNNGRNKSGKAVGSVGLQGFNHHGACAAAGKRFYKRGWQRRNKSCIGIKPCY